MGLNEQPDDIDTLWQLLEDLPDTNVEGSTTLKEIRLEDLDVGGLWDANKGSIEISNRYPSWGRNSRTPFDTRWTRHARDARRQCSRRGSSAPSGWRSFEADVEGIDAWVHYMGVGRHRGGPIGSSSVPPSRRRSVPRTPSAGGSDPQPPGHSWLRPDCLPRLAYVNTEENWWDHTERFHQTPDGKQACYLNFWYGTLCAVDSATLDLVRRMPRS